MSVRSMQKYYDNGRLHRGKMSKAFTCTDCNEALKPRICCCNSTCTFKFDVGTSNTLNFLASTSNRSRPSTCPRLLTPTMDRIITTLQNQFREISLEEHIKITRKSTFTRTKLNSYQSSMEILRKFIGKTISSLLEKQEYDSEYHQHNPMEEHLSTLEEYNTDSSVGEETSSCHSLDTVLLFPSSVGAEISGNPKVRDHTEKQVCDTVIPYNIEIQVEEQNERNGGSSSGPQHHVRIDPFYNVEEDLRSSEPYIEGYAFSNHKVGLLKNVHPALPYLLYPIGCYLCPGVEFHGADSLQHLLEHTLNAHADECPWLYERQREIFSFENMVGAGIEYCETCNECRQNGYARQLYNHLQSVHPSNSRPCSTL